MNWPWSRPRRCRQWTMGPFMTYWRCRLPRKHDGRHSYEPDLWAKRRGWQRFDSTTDSASRGDQ